VFFYLLLNIEYRLKEGLMQPRSLAAGTIVLVAATLVVTVYYQQSLSQISEKLALWTIIAEILGLGGLISAEAYVFLWSIRARTLNYMT
jgi:asparagine N-glycosylation enzyme membrane subunit Stt3